LGLPPVIEVPTATPGPTDTPVPTLPPNCDDYTFSDFGITHDNHVVVNINNYAATDVTVEYFEMTWESAYLWAIATGYFDIELDWFEWDGGNRVNLDDINSPSSASVDRLLPAGFSNTWETDFDWGGEVEWVFVNDFGLTPENFGFYVELDNDCVIRSWETVAPPPTPNCDLYSCGDFTFQSWAQVDVELFNGDEMSTLITGIDYDWDYAEAYGELVGSGSENLNVDFMYYAGQYIWGEGNGGVRDWNSTTNTASDSSWTFPGGWSPSLPPFDANSSSTLRVDFDNDWSTWYTDLLPTDFGVTVSFLNGCTLTCAPVERPLPEPNCDLYTIQDFEIRGNNAVRTYLTNGDILSTNVERIVLDWDYAEALSDFVIGSNILYADDFRWDWDYIWSGNNDGIGDLSSVTDTSVDSPDAWHSDNTDFDAGDTVVFEGDFEYAVGYDPDGAFWSWGLRPEDFGATFYFENGCVLELPAVDRPLTTPTPDCEDIYAADVRLSNDDFQIRVRNDNVATAYLIDSTLTWPGPACPQGSTPGVPYVNYISWNWSSYYGTDTYCSPVNAVPSPPGELPGTSSRWWSSDFNNGLPYGYFQGVLTFEYPDWGICIVEAAITIVEPTGTPTTDPNATSTPTRTLRPTETNTPIPSETLIPSITPTNMPTWTPRPTTQPPTLTPTPLASPTNSDATATPTPWPTQPGGG
jgi:hypothetical protein